MAIAETAAPRFEMGRVVKRTISVIGNNPITFGILSLVVGIPLLALQLTSPFATGGISGENPFNASVLRYSGLFWFVYLLCSFVLQAGIVHGTVTYLNGRAASLADCLSTGISFLLQLALMTVLMFLAFVAGAMLLVIPAIILMMMWFVAVPACVVERTGVPGALGRSRALTRGYRWPIFGLYVAYIFFGVMIGFTWAGLTGTPIFAGSPEAAIAAAANRSFVQLAGSTIITMLNSIIGTTLVASVYYELRQIKEGIGPETLAAVFD